MNKIIAYIDRCDLERATFELNQQWDNFPWPSRYLKILFPVAVSALDLHCPTPHIIKYHHTLHELCGMLSGDTSRLLIEQYLGYLINHPRIKLSYNELDIAANCSQQDNYSDLIQGLNRNSFDNSLYYLLENRNEEGYASAALQLVMLCGRYIDPQGHNFTIPFSIYQAGLISDRNNEPIALRSLLEYTFRVSQCEETKLQKTSKPHSFIRNLTIKKTGLSGHNIILLSKILKADDILPPEYIDHLYFGLWQNIQDCPTYYHDVIEPDDKYLSAVKMLKDKSLADEFISILRESDKPELHSGIIERILRFFTSIDNHQPHYYTYTLAVGELSEYYPEHAADLLRGLIQFLKTEIGEHGLKGGFDTENR